MSYQQIKSNLRGVAFTNPTPFDETTGEIKTDELSANIRYIKNSGGKLIIPCGNTGEYYSLTNKERVEVVKSVADVMGKQGTVIGGVGGSTQTAIDLANSYESVGADGIMIMDPVHTYQHQKGLLEYYRKIIESTSLGVVIYKRGPEITLDLIQELSTYENVVGVKYAVNDIKNFSKAVNDTEADVVWSNGIAERFSLPFAIEGAEGFTTGIGNFLPEEVLDLYDAINTEDWSRVKWLRELLRPLEDIREEPGYSNEISGANNVPVVKYGMELAGLYGGPVREPLVDLNEDDKQRTENYYSIVKDEV